MAESKTEKATPKKRRDAGRRGQSFKARDLVVAALMLCGVLAVVWLGSLLRLGAAFIGATRSGFTLDLHDYVAEVLLLGLQVILPILAVSVAATVSVSLLQSRGMLATQAIRFDLGVLNPMKGFKKIFSVRTVKELVKTLLYLAAFCAAIVLVWNEHREQIFAQVHASVPAIIALWRKMIVDMVLACLGCIAAILVLDALVELFIYLRDLRMDKQEVKRERKENEGDPMIKEKRKEVRMELLTAQDKYDIENSRMVIANPTHVAIGIYFKPELSPIPLVSVRERNQRALAVRRYAEQVGVPVIVDVPLARRLYRTHRLYDMVSLKEIHAVVHLLLWLQEVEQAGMGEES
ncbi:EscU/YscU/HrcU family type III secretion system export apparatus switch protein [Herbaspirillum sp. SJZ099]|uniref:EscU/YscU/HrcU family type III secretion system export apparatus switch protein n=1 Tax=Herbaspirillum sp. SJZ099 TaxID=2572916 RepID=UPI0011A1177E|nr:EscU/YscU/HrcU family type III secretion system export apparatus switch protein [Herbaspirillum sp. SJZ099]TWC66605.1 type III secretion protein U [Herbaspirillum sp. SJZ099]